ncbi:MAG: hypothetical protein ACRDD1_09360 [Planctomycetia bacterium]
MTAVTGQQNRSADWQLFHRRGKSSNEPAEPCPGPLGSINHKINHGKTIGRIPGRDAWFGIELAPRT